MCVCVCSHTLNLASVYVSRDVTHAGSGVRNNFGHIRSWRRCVCVGMVTFSLSDINTLERLQRHSDVTSVSAVRHDDGRSLNYSETQTHAGKIRPRSSKIPRYV